MKKINKKTITTIIVVIIMMGLVGGLGPKKKPQNLADITLLNKGELITSVNVSGSVKSAEEHHIYSKENLSVKEVRVEVGDKVKKGDILAVLDAQSIEKDIEKTNITIASNIKSMESEKRTIESNIGTTQKNAESAKLNLEKQNLNYITVKKEYEAGSNAEIQNAKGSMERAEIDKNTSEKNYQNAKQLYEQDFISKSEYEASENSYKVAVINYDNAAESYKRAVENLEKNYKQAQIDLHSAKNNYETSMINLKAVKQKNTDTYTYAIEGQKVEMSKAQDRVKNAIITAPADGTITSVNVKVGQMPSNILFELEDLDHLVITTYIKEYDVASISIGQKVIIQSDGTKDRKINGEVSSVAPTTRKDTASDSNEFETEIRVTDKGTGLKIGMETRMNIILEQKPDVFYISYDSILTREDGQEVIYVVEKGSVKEILVDTGIESDIYVEIQGDGLAEGMQVISSPAHYKPGQKVKIK